ncbi:MAG: DUF86 domain-containing protein [Chloroflexota bacterium]
MRDDQPYLEYILESIQRVDSYLMGAAGLPDRARLDNEPVVQDAVLRRLETLSDAASHLSTSLKQRHPNVPWRDVGDFRNVLAHGYTGVDLDRVWGVIMDDLAQLMVVVEAELLKG